MRRRVRAALSVVVAGLAASGCVSNISGRRPFADYRGKSLVLTEPARLLVTEAWTGGNVRQMLVGAAKVNELFANSDPLLQTSFYGFEKFTPLPAGTPVRLTKFLRRVADNNVFIEAHGVVYVADQGKDVRFLYTWAERCDRYLRRAPWEPASTPDWQRRLIRPEGCPEFERADHVRGKYR